MRRCHLGILMFGLGLAACGGEEPPGAEAAANTDEYTLDSCETNIADDVPAFYKKYFKCVTISTSGDSVVIETKGMPPHKSFYYSEGSANHTAYVSGGADYYQNPNSIAEKSIRMTVPNNPTSKGLTIDDTLVDGAVGSSTDEYTMGTAGVAIDSVSLFNPLAAPGDDIEDEFYSFDDYYGHPENRGTYHYHTVTKGPLEVLQAAGLTTSTAPGEATVELFGMMCDGTLILGCTELDGGAPDGANLDSQNGHSHDMVDEEGTTHFTDRYHTHICWGTFGDHRFTPEIQHYDSCSI